ncbi:UV-resistance [Lactiplantibacillus plantarum]|uniref:UV-resistance n=2 Tax=Lactiplantibacillus plantarum TaxID=1590 RepID=UPI003C239C07
MMNLFTDDEPHGVFFLIDNKSFYASCEANPLKVSLVVLSSDDPSTGGRVPTSATSNHSTKNLSNIF